jgi:hypothetical protein
MNEDWAMRDRRESSSAIGNEVLRLRAENERLRAVLELIAGGNGKCIYSHDPGFREGSNAAFEQDAEVALEALKVRP